jgi:Aspartate decarboxylase
MSFREHDMLAGKAFELDSIHNVANGAEIRAQCGVVQSKNEIPTRGRSAKLLKMMKSRIHRVTVTRADLNYEGSMGIDEQLLELAGMLSGEAAHVWSSSLLFAGQRKHQPSGTPAK